MMETFIVIIFYYVQFKNELLNINKKETINESS